MSRNNLPEAKIHILGGGPAGMSAAYYAHKKQISFQLFESTNQIGGNAKTLNFGEFLFDTGAHRLHDKNRAVTRDIKQILNGELNEVSAPSKIFYDNKYIDFPIRAKDILNKINYKTNLKIISENIINLMRTNRKVDNFKELAYRNYGKTLSDLFLINYTEKLWGESSDLLGTSISGGRLKNLSFYSTIKEFVTGVPSSDHIDGSFLYPKYGFGAIFSSIEEMLNKEDILFNSPIKKIFHDGKKINKILLDSNKEISANHVISTLPLPILINQLEPVVPINIKKIVNSITYRNLSLFILFLNKKQFSDNASIYFPQEEVPFTRIYEPKNRSLMMAPENKTSIVIEVPTSSNEDINEKKTFNTITSFLVKNKFINNEDILGNKVISMPFAYPIITNNNELFEVYHYLKKIKNLYLIGRSAEFKYLHVHDLFNKSKQIIREIKEY